MAELGDLRRPWLYAFDDLGVGWTPLHDGTWPLLAVMDVAVDPLDPDTLLVATEGEGMNRTTDGGESWEIGIGGTADLVAQSRRFRPGSSRRGARRCPEGAAPGLHGPPARR